MNRNRVALGLSGGVDSAVSAYLLKKQGFDVSCVYLKCFDSDIPGCRGDNDRKDALAVAMHLGLPFQVLDFRRQYKAAVIDYFKKEYLLGRTPNPDVVCNRDIKFGLFLDWAIKAGFDYVATGHYAKLRSAAFSRKSRNKTKIAKNNSRRSRSFASFANTKAYTYDQLQENNNSVFLVQPRDVHKDQTYFLWAVPREKFKQVLFPLGDYLKTEVREIARKAGLLVAEKKDSTGICFVGEVRVEEFLKGLGVKEREGEVVVRDKMVEMVRDGRDGKDGNNPNNLNNLNNLNPSNHYRYRVIGSHRGIWFYTIGQRHGFSTDLRSSKNRDKGQGIKAKGQTGSASALSPKPSALSPSYDRLPLYVIEKDIKKNRLIVGFGAETYCGQFVVSQVNWLVSEKARPSVGRPGLNKFVCLVRIRHGGELIPCLVIGSPFPACSRLRRQPMAGRSVVGNKSAGFQSAGLIRSRNRKPITVSLSIPQRGIAPGQSAVFYSKDGTVVGGGIIQ